MKLKETKIHEQKSDDPNSTRLNTEKQITRDSESKKKKRTT